jgi:hypothetical protein
MEHIRPAPGRLRVLSVPGVLSLAFSADLQIHLRVTVDFAYIGLAVHG